MANDALGTLIAKLSADISDLKKGLADGKRELQIFKTVASDIGQQVTRLLSFAGVAVGIAGMVSALKSFSAASIEVGTKTESLRAATYALGKNFGVSADFIDSYVNQLKQLKVPTAEAQQAVMSFMKSGISLENLQPLVLAAKNISATIGGSFVDTFSTLIDSIATGLPRGLTALKIPMAEVLSSAKKSLKELEEDTTLTGAARSKAILEYVLAYADTIKNTSENISTTYKKQLAELKFLTEEAKNALWEFLQPILTAITGEKVKAWEELLNWMVKSKASFHGAGEVIAIYVERLASAAGAVLRFAIANKELVKNLLEFFTLIKASQYIVAFGTALMGVTAAFKGVGLSALLASTYTRTFIMSVEGVATASIAATTAAGAGFVALASKILMAVGALGVFGAYKAFKDPKKYGGNWKNAPEGMIPEATSNAPVEEEEEAPPKRGPFSSNELNDFRKTYKGLADEIAATQAKQLNAAVPKSGGQGGGGKGGAGGKGENDKLLSEYMKVLETKRKAELADAQESFDVLRATNDKKRAELEKSLTEGLIDGQTYYQRLQELQQGETTASLAMIQQKKQAQEQAYQEAYASIGEKDMSAEAIALAQQKLEIQNKTELAKLNAEEVKAKLEGEKKVVDELKRQVEVKKQYQQKTEDLNIETAQLLGAITEQEAILQKLLLDWQRAKQSAIDAGASPEYLTALKENYQAKKFDANETYKAFSANFLNSVYDFGNALFEGSKTVAEALDNFGKNILQSTFKLFFEDVGKAVSQGIKNMVAEIANSMQSSSGSGGIGSFFSGIGGWLKGLFGGGDGMHVEGSSFIETSAHGNAYIKGIRQSFGNGAVFTRPTLFQLASGVGQAGEQGAEGILPLSRIGNDLGVKALFPGTAGPPNVNVINNLGVEAKPTVQQDSNGDLTITLDKTMADIYARGGKFRNILNADRNRGF